MIVPLHGAQARDRALAGGKAAALAELAAAGFPVPEGLVVTSPSDPADALDAALADLEARFGSAALWAVRSSALAEDLAEASFAGQYDTVLGVPRAEVASAVRRVWASFAGDRAAQYRRAHGIRETGGAVLVQRLVPASSAGVAFTVDPVTGDADTVIVEASFGLGESVVAGRVTPDRFVVDKQEGAIRKRDIAETQRARRPSLSDAQVTAVAALALRVEAQRGAPVDVEWAVHAGDVYLLQARPITAAGWAPDVDTPIDPRFPIYSNGNVGEVMPGCLTPLSWSNVATPLEQAFRQTQEALGTMRDVGPGYIVMGYFFHRLYLNVSYFIAATDNAPGGDRRTALEEIVGPGAELELPPPPPGWRHLTPSGMVRAVRMLARFVEMQRTLDAAIRDATAVTEEQRRMAAEGRFEREGVEWLAAAPSPREMLPALVHIRASMLAQVHYAQLRKLTAHWLGDTDGTLAAELVTGIGDLMGALPAAGIDALARLVREDPDLLAAFAEEPEDERLHERLVASPRFRDALADFLRRYGHRGYGEGELRNPRWRERPAEVIALVRPLLAAGTTPAGDIRARQEAAASAARGRALDRLSRLRRGRFLSALEVARRSVAAREQTKDLISRLLDVARQRYRAAARRLVAEGRLGAEDDVFFLLREELLRLGRGEVSRGQVDALVRRRRRDFERSRTVSVPKIQVGKPRYTAAPDTQTAGDRLTGLGVSPGRVEGAARVVLDPRTGAGILPGEVLVVPVTDLAWTPLFLNAAALVVEVGGTLSHGSIVAREYGIPAVVSVSGATRLIRDGDLLVVDGHQGVVTVRPSAAAPPPAGGPRSAAPRTASAAPPLASR
jgi:phosphohistidine swiveling domain-containing protein